MFSPYSLDTELARVNEQWLRMQPKADANLTELKELVKQQFIWFASTIFSEVAEETVGLSFYERLKNYNKNSGYLTQILDFPDSQQAYSCDFVPNYKAHAITCNPIFPPEWQWKAHRTFLPEDLSKQLETWQNYIFDINQGKLQNYLFDLYLYKYTDYFYKHWEELKSCAQSSSHGMSRKGDSWAKRNRVVSVREQIVNFGEIYLHPAPVWLGCKLQGDYYHSAKKGIYELIYKQIEEYKQINHLWNSRVPVYWQKPLLDKFDFEYFIDNAVNNLGLNKIFSWMERCCSEKMGLFLSDIYLLNVYEAWPEQPKNWR